MIALSSKLVESVARALFARDNFSIAYTPEEMWAEESEDVRAHYRLEAGVALLATFTTLRDAGPSEAMLHAALTATRPRHPSIGDVIEIEWREMMTALIAEVSQP